MPPKRSKDKAAPAATAPTAAAGTAASSAEADLLKECDKALCSVNNNTVKAKKEVAKLLEKKRCSLTFRTQSALHLMVAQLQAGDRKQHLLAAVAAADEGVAAKPLCVQLHVARARAHHRLAEALTLAAGEALLQPEGAGKDAKVTFGEANAAWDAATTCVSGANAALDAEGAELGDLLIQEKRMLLQEKHKRVSSADMANLASKAHAKEALDWCAVHRASLLRCAVGVCCALA
jgi:hypothetical protein